MIKSQVWKLQRSNQYEEKLKSIKEWRLLLSKTEMWLLIWYNILKKYQGWVPDRLKEYKEKRSSPANGKMFNMNKSKAIGDSGKEIFHHFVKKTIILCKRAWLDIQPIVAVSCTRVKSLNETDWGKSIQLMKMTYQPLIWVEEVWAYWFIDASFTVHLVSTLLTKIILKPLILVLKWLRILK